MQLRSVQSTTSDVHVNTSPAVDTAGPQSIQQHRAATAGAGPGTAAGDMSLESSMTDDDSSRADASRPQRQRRHRGADDVFPTRTLKRYQVCRVVLWHMQMIFVCCHSC